MASRYIYPDLKVGDVVRPINFEGLSGEILKAQAKKLQTELFVVRRVSERDGDERGPLIYLEGIIYIEGITRDMGFFAYRFEKVSHRFDMNDLDDIHKAQEVFFNLQ